MKKTYVLDANAILDYVENGPGAGTMQRLLKGVAKGDISFAVSAINMGEVFYWLWKEKGEPKARQVVTALSDGRLMEIVPVDLAQSLLAGEFKSRHKIPYVDGIAAALCSMRNATLVTSDRDFEKLGRRFSILWLPR